MKIAAVQLKPRAGEVAANTERHLMFIELAASQGAQLILFPELSLTGYEPKLAAALAMTPDAPSLDPLQACCDRLDVLIGVGAPLRVGAQVRIGMVWIRPKRSRLSYTKQLLHADELPYFSGGDDQLVLELGGRKLAPAICYESLQPGHAAWAAKLGAGVYLASVAKPAHAMVKAMRHYPVVASQHQMFVIMSNCVGPCDDFISVGGAAAWGPSGQALGQLDGESEGVLVVDLERGEAISCVI